ncbi:hypothetical protein [Desulfuromonas acetoxidans]|uniref:Uncharacterized protein n=1 Tax=Desulfuromonas acetoxidans (strain DSM 684 / 11070) TaxID=281689 RepID=Q1K014_DESA6|nr:hypothetical protein [Desulfuromonas acetoxidans]EAT15728.1 hypothetical protein Dace_2428 [Desulfuromonas acetoxidans DSM 684]MBF0646008.1 hypothetical protein [Desulfuromonas acetoxidans]NVD25881.1 hypothetical protein [Desulfuromonas acetoxidans]NVE16913.1 hypothetical protein [Desulfuromonas acetoxidans]
MMMFLSAPASFLFFYLAWHFIRRKEYRNGMVMSLIAVFLLVVTVAFGALGYFWSTLDYQGPII